MHDFHAADNLLKISLSYAQKNKFKKIDKIKIELGKFIEHGQEILADNLKFNIKMLAKGTIAKNSEIVIIEKRGENGYKLIEIEGE
ncbi:MAG: hydrogenase/urease maturation nickel metallochaperone HypA [Patescibacteria group bacterium]|nr:hydrogenase/urease maturation nickel metallochaperone HypA [Patescibacteria group bacterium]